MNAFRKGARGNTVAKLRYKLGVYPLTDPFDDLLEEKIKEFQIQNELTPDGIVGPITHNKIFNAKYISHFAPIGIMVHSMSEYVHYKNEILRAHEFLKNINLSVHALIDPEGEIHEMTLTHRKAHHAGVSYFQGLTNLNQFFLGFEILVPGVNTYGDFVEKIKDPNCFNEKQYESSILLCKLWMKKYNLTYKDVVRHSDVAGDHVRGTGHGKVDPGDGFNWDYFINRLKDDTI